jgi:hypothetical protein
LRLWLTALLASATLAAGLGAGYYIGVSRTLTIVSTTTLTSEARSSEGPRVTNAACSGATATATTLTYSQSASAATSVVAGLLCARTAQLIVQFSAPSRVSSQRSSASIKGDTITNDCSAGSVEIIQVGGFYQLTADFSSCPHSGSAPVAAGATYVYTITVVSNPQPSPATTSYTTLSGSVVAE